MSGLYGKVVGKFLLNRWPNRSYRTYATYEAY